LIISERSLSVFECRDDVLAGKLASDSCREAWRWLRCRLLPVHDGSFHAQEDPSRPPVEAAGLVLPLAGPAPATGVDKATLADRVIYMYVVPLRIAGRKFYDVLRATAWRSSRTTASCAARCSRRRIACCAEEGWLLTLSVVASSPSHT